LKVGEDGNPKTMVDKIIKAGFKTLDLINYFTCGKDEVRAWTVRKFKTCPEAAGVIHTDFEKSFISCEQFRYKDLKKLGSENKVREAGKKSTKGKKYIV